jgi:hypothetical protein
MQPLERINVSIACRNQTGLQKSLVLKNLDMAKLYVANLHACDWCADLAVISDKENMFLKSVNNVI